MDRINIIIAFILLSGAAFAQKIELGPKIGGGLSHLTSSTYFEYGAKTSYSVGIQGSTSLTDKITLRPGLLFNSVGGKKKVTVHHKESGSRTSEIIKFRPAHLKVPLDLILGIGGDVRFEIGVGGYSSILMFNNFKNGQYVNSVLNFDHDCTSKLDQDEDIFVYTSDDHECAISPSDSFDRFDFGLKCSLGMSIKQNTNTISFGTEFSYGLVEVLDSSKNMSLEYFLGYTFQMKKKN